jgi:molybdenum cofactor cytidylyltransferase
MFMGIPAILLAAGASTRLGRPKQLVEYHGETLLARAIRLTQEAGCDPVFVVLGANLETILPTGLSDRAVPVINKDWQEGISSSIQSGLRAVHGALPATEGVLLLTCDQPRLSAEHLGALMRRFSSEYGDVIVASAYAGALGTPAVFPRGAFRQLFELRGDTGARALFTKPARPVVGVPFPDGEFDIDTPADLDQLF